MLYLAEEAFGVNLVDVSVTPEIIADVFFALPTVAIQGAQHAPSRLDTYIQL